MDRIFKVINQINFFCSDKKPPEFRNSFDRLYFSIYKELQSPEAIEWFPTYLCSSNCQYCGGYDKEAISKFGRLVPYKRIIKIIELSGKIGTTTWNIGGRGGEPLLYPNLVGILEEIKRYNMKGILITNGLQLDAEFIARLIKANWDILRISLDSHIAAIHDEIRGAKGNFDKIDKALILFKKSKIENNTNFPNIVCCPVITNKNYRHVVEYVEYCVERGVDEIQFMPLINVHERAERLKLSDNQKRGLIELLQMKIHEDRIKHNISFITSLYKNNYEAGGQKLNSEADSNNKLYCIHLWKTLVISEDGYLSPCSLIKDKLLKIKGSHLKSWSSAKINQLRKKILRDELIDSVCKDCCGPLRNETDNFNQYLLKNYMKEIK